MKLPINFVLYLGALGLLGQAGVWVCHASDKIWAAKPKDLTAQGQNLAAEKVAAGKGTGPVTQSWAYMPAEWWQTFKTANFIGKPPPKPVDPGVTPTKVEPKVDVRPLIQIVEMVFAMSDGRADGKGGDTHVVVRYKPEVTSLLVVPPEILRQMTSGPMAGTPPVRGDVTPPPPGQPQGGPGRPQRPPQNPNAPRPATNLPVTAGTREYIQHVKVGDALWEPFSDIKLVRVSPDAEVAWFVRKVPAAAAGEPEGSREDPLMKVGLGLTPEQLLTIRQYGGKVGTAAAAGTAAVAAGNGSQKWIQHEETTKVDNVWHIGTKETQQFQEDQQGLLESVNLDSYKSKYGDLQGVRIANVDKGMADRFGVQQGDVILEVNGDKVRNRAEALQVGKQQYNRGTRTFVVKFLSNGQIVERTYQAPDRN